MDQKDMYQEGWGGSVQGAIGGFDERLELAEDHVYVRRAARWGRSAVRWDARIQVSMRRLDTEGLVGLAAKYAWSELHTPTGRRICRTPFAC